MFHLRSSRNTTHTVDTFFKILIRFVCLLNGFRDGVARMGFRVKTAHTLCITYSNTIRDGYDFWLFDWNMNETYQFHDGGALLDYSIEMNVSLENIDWHKSRLQKSCFRIGRSKCYRRDSIVSDCKQ